MLGFIKRMVDDAGHKFCVWNACQDEKNTWQNRKNKLKKPNDWVWFCNIFPNLDVVKNFHDLIIDKICLFISFEQ